MEIRLVDAEGVILPPKSCKALPPPRSPLAMTAARPRTHTHTCAHKNRRTRTPSAHALTTAVGAS